MTETDWWNDRDRQATPAHPGPISLAGTMAGRTTTSQGPGRRGNLSRTLGIMVSSPPGRPPGRRERLEGSAAAESVHATLTLTRDDYDRLNKVAEELGLTLGEVIQRSIATALFLQDQLNMGSRILIEDRKGTLREFVPP